MRTEEILSVAHTAEGTVQLHRRLENSMMNPRHSEYVVLDEAGDVVLEMPEHWSPLPSSDSAPIQSEYVPEYRKLIRYLVDLKHAAYEEGEAWGKVCGRKDIVDTIHELIPLEGLMRLLDPLFVTISQVVDERSREGDLAVMDQLRKVVAARAAKDAMESGDDASTESGTLCVHGRDPGGCGDCFADHYRPRPDPWRRMRRPEK